MESASHDLYPFHFLGIPGDVSTALLPGVITGLLMIRNAPSVAYMIYLACVVAAVMVLAFQVVQEEIMQ